MLAALLFTPFNNEQKQQSELKCQNLRELIILRKDYIKIISCNAGNHRMMYQLLLSSYYQKIAGVTHEIMKMQNRTMIVIRGLKKK